MFHLHDHCNTRRPANARSVECSKPGCNRGTRHHHFALCEIHAVEEGLCEACGESLIPKVRTSPGGPGSIPSLVPVNESPRGIAPGGCMNQEGLRQAQCRAYFHANHEAIFADIEFHRDRYIVWLEGETNISTLPQKFWGQKLEYRNVAEREQPKTATVAVTIAFSSRSKQVTRDRLLGQIGGWKGVTDVEQPFKLSPDAYLLRFYVIHVDTEANAANARQKAEDLGAVEYAGLGDPRKLS